MPQTLTEILGPEGAIARRMADRYEHRPQQLEMAAAVEQAFVEGRHLLVEAGTGVGKSFAYLLPAIDYAVKNKKRVVISTHTISLQEQLIEKDIPLIQSIYPDEFTAVLCKGRGNYLCKRRLEQARQRQGMLFDTEKQLESLWTIEEWATHTTDGSLADLPQVPDPGVWDRVCAEQGNCLGKKCKFYDQCVWQAAKRRMQSGNILIVNHALFFSDLSLRMAGVNYLPKYDLVILDEGHTVEDVAGEHFGLRISEGSVRYNLRALYDIKRGKGMLSTHGSAANDAIRDVVDLSEISDRFFDGVAQWQETQGRTNGRVQEANVVQNTLSPKLRDLGKHLKEMMTKIEDEGELSEIGSMSEKVKGMAEAIDSIMSQSVADAVYWFDVSSRTPKRVSLHCGPINVAEGLKRYLFEKVRSVVITSATMCTSSGRQGHGLKTRATKGAARGTGFQPVQNVPNEPELRIRQGAYLPHWTKAGSIYAVNFRLADALPQDVLESWKAERDALIERTRIQNRKLTDHELAEHDRLHGERVEKYLDAGHGKCWLEKGKIAELVKESLQHFNGERYRLLAWCIMPNHIHAVVQPLPGFELAGILHSWKRHTALEANRLLHHIGEFWQPEYYDHLIRDEDDLRHQIEYAWANSDHAGMKGWQWRGRDDALIDALLSGSEVIATTTEHGLETRATGDAQRATGFQPAQAEPDTPVAASFKYIASRLGAENPQTLQLGSPFDYKQQATLYIETDLPEPNDTTRFLPAACDRIIHYLKQTNGGAFVLFTSYSMLIEAANRLLHHIGEFW
ncbi:MAG TPA: DEAD/DEAH box helicase, partial [Tepidisphaeraceae bacterium]